MSNKAVFEKEKTREEETPQVQEGIAMAYQAHALAQTLLAHYLSAQPWVAPPIPVAGAGPYAFQSHTPYPGVNPYYGAAACLGPSQCCGTACYSQPVMQGLASAVPASGIPWPSPVAMAPGMQMAPWPFQFTSFIKP